MDTSLDKINAVLKGNRHTYRIKSVLGQGGFGITYLASAREGGTVYLYAVKEHFIKDTCDRAADGSVTCSQAASQRVNESMGDFLREAQRLESLRNGNSSIVRVADIFEFNISRPFFTFALLITLLMLSGKASAQCYQPTMNAAQQAERAGNMERAAALYHEAQCCWDGNSQQKASAQAGETRCRKAVERKQKDEQRKREEAECKAEVQRQQTSNHSNETIRVNGVEFTMVWVAGGSFTMGATSEQGSAAFDDEKPTHSVTLSGYYIGETEVTQAQWKAVMGSNPSYYTGDNLPVQYVSWDDAQAFVLKLNALTGRTFRLPTEAEWEYAARGGNKSRGYKYAGSDDISDVAWYHGNSGSKPHPVGQKCANELGLYDMSGNMCEWCSDWYGSYSISPQRDPQGPSNGSDRVVRGGIYNGGMRPCRVSSRTTNSPSYVDIFHGLRLALSF